MKKYFAFLLLWNFLAFSQNTTQSIGFKENKGQIVDQKGKSNASVLYLLNSNGLNVQLKKNGFSYDIYEVKKNPVISSVTAKTLPYHIPKKDQKEEFNLEYVFHRVDIDFVNSNPKVELITEQKSSDFDNYYNVPDKPEGVLGVYQYKQVTYKNIYPNIDVVFTIPKDSQKTVEYNFVIHPKGKISDIKLKFNGAETDLVDNKIQMSVRFGKMEETLPASWIEEKGHKKMITIGYQKLQNNVYGFRSANFLIGKKVVIDPVPNRLWGTFIGGERWDKNYSIDRDASNNVYTAGATWSMTNLASSGAHQTVFGSSLYSSTFILDGFISKFDENGNRLWTTYYGGQLDDFIKEIKISKNNSLLFFCGNSRSNNNISTSNSFKPNKSGSYDEMFLGQLNSNGIRQWATYYGNDNGLTFANSISVDNQNNVYLSGSTTSDDFIATPNSFQDSVIDNNRFDGFLAKFDSDGNRIWGTYLGGINDDFIEDSDIDPDGNIILVGSTRSTSGIATSNSYQPNYSIPTNNASDGDGMIIKFSPNGDRIWGTYFGDQNSDWIYNCKITGDNLYFSGETENTDIATPNAFETTMLTTVRSSYFASFNLKTQNKTWLSYSKGKITSIYSNNKDQVYIAGESASYWDIASPDAFNPINSNGNSFIIKLNIQCQKIWGTFLGFYHSPFGPQITADDFDVLYVFGSVSSYLNVTDYGISTTNSFQYLPNGDYETYLVKFQECLTNPLISSNSPICIGKTLELKASGGTNYSWTGPNGFTSTDQNPTITNVSSTNSGEYICLITGTGGCDDTQKTNVIIGDIETPVPDLATLPSITGDCNTIITTIPTATDACAGAITATTTSPLSYTLPGTYTIVWNYNDGNGNTSTQNQTVTITQQPLPNAASPQIFCVQQNATLTDVQITGQNIKWYSNLTAGTLVPITTVVQDKATYYASQTISGCESERIPVTINILNTLAPTGNPKQSFCTGQNPTILNLEITGTAIKWYNTSTNGSLLPETTALQNGQTFYASQTENNCESSRFGITVSIVNTPSVPNANTEQAFCKKENKTLNDIQITGQNIKWFDTNFSASPISNTALLEDNRTYYASQTVGCESDRIPILVHVYDTALPTGKSSQQFCIDQIATLENLNIKGTDLKWYDSATNGSLLSETNLLETRTYYATQTINNCESERFAVSVKIQDTSIPFSDSPQSFCIQKNAKISNIAIDGQNIKWYESTSSNNPLSESTSLEDGITYYASQTISNCESDRIPVTVNILGATTSECIHFVEELPYPKFFTPNGDGHNDTWTIDPNYLAPNSSIRIFDRYGKLIKELILNTSWDGNYLGNQEPSSDYWFTVTRFNGKEFRGHFSLKR
ncbi:T9SS type B sorting domain-containing protein [Flavobacterium sp. UBA4854]|uniref:DUF7948 domain-containing protein n=1 Tax=Flavobacterium sp. UBA4854 TaxID=1946548 RepID=UPI00257D3728|nr:T9SS type B sorting domain-containing protein [Flavobacterium sp. UBA4854]